MSHTDLRCTCGPNYHAFDMPGMSVSIIAFGKDWPLKERDISNLEVSTPNKICLILAVESKRRFRCEIQCWMVVGVVRYYIVKALENTV